MTPKEEMISKIQKALLKEVEFIRENPKISLDDKVTQVDVLFDTVKFLDNYDENIKVLNKHIADKGIEK